MDGRGVPLSIIVTAANVNDGKRIDEVLSAIALKRERTPIRRSRHLCADAAHRSAEVLQIIDLTRTATSLTSSIAARKQQPSGAGPGRRRVAGLSRSAIAGSMRFRKLLVRYEKLERSFLALNHLAAAIIAFRKVPLVVNIIYG